MKKFVILITGDSGFIGTNLRIFLAETDNFEIEGIQKNTPKDILMTKLLKADVIVHLAGVNRPTDEKDFETFNVVFTQEILDFLDRNKLSTPILFTSSEQVVFSNPYGHSKKEAEKLILNYAKKCNAKALILRLCGVFGKFAKPGYNSVVATFCHNIAHDLPIEIINGNREIELVHIDDVIKEIREFIDWASISEKPEVKVKVMENKFRIKVKELADLIKDIETYRKDGKLHNVGKGFVKALYSTYVSYLPRTKWTRALVMHSDYRGSFVEVLKTDELGQISFFTAKPGVVRGEHYHHTKTEKFLVLNGVANFRFRNLVTDEYHEVQVRSDAPVVVDSIPGWAHDICNLGSEDLVVLVWANEVFEPRFSDTFAAKVKNEET